MAQNRQGMAIIPRPCNLAGHTQVDSYRIAEPRGPCYRYFHLGAGRQHLLRFEQNSVLGQIDCPTNASLHYLVATDHPVFQIGRNRVAAFRSAVADP